MQSALTAPCGKSQTLPLRGTKRGGDIEGYRKTCGKRWRHGRCFPVKAWVKMQLQREIFSETSKKGRLRELKVEVAGKRCSVDSSGHDTTPWKMKGEEKETDRDRTKRKSLSNVTTKKKKGSGKGVCLNNSRVETRICPVKRSMEEKKEGGGIAHEYVS